MKKLAHKISFGIVLLFISSSIAAKGKSAEKEKVINELIVLKASETIEVDTKFGELKINTWDRNEVSLKVTVRVKDGNEKRAQELIDRIDINISHTPSKLSIKTDISGDDDEIKIKTSKDGYLEINYELTVPSGNLLDIKNSFGALFLDKMKASVKIDMKFGAATIGELSGEQNHLSFEFCDPIVINKFYKGKIDLKFSKLELLKSEDLILTSEMSGSKIDKVTNTQCYLKFGSLDLNEVNVLQLESQMSAVKIESLHGSGKIENKYGALTIAKVRGVCSKLEIDGEFSPIKIYLERGGNYNINANSKMSGLKLPEGSIESEKPAQTNKSAIRTNSSFIGRIGEKGINSSILNITSSFGDVKLMLTD